MNRQAQRRATFQDVLDAPPNMVAELVNGALHLHPRPAARHARATFRLAMKLGDPYDDGVGEPGGWYFAVAPELHLGSDLVVPDLAGWRRERMGTFPDTPAIELVPDWVCEILSPGTPEAELLEPFALRDGAWVLTGTAQGDDEVRLAPFEATGFPLSALWP